MYSSEYARNVAIYFRKVLEIARKWEYIRRNPAEDVELIVARSRKKVLLTDEQFQLLIENTDERDRALIGFGRWEGCRISEILARRWRDIDFRKSTVAIYSQCYKGHFKDKLKSKDGKNHTTIPRV
jgi:integrase